MNFELLITNAITEKPISFLAGSVRYYLYQPSLGVYLLSRSLIEAMGVDLTTLRLSSEVEALRLVHAEPEAALRLIVLNTLRGKQEAHDERKIKRRMTQMERNLSHNELAQLLLLVLSQDSYNDITEHYGIRQEQERRNTIASIKQDRYMLHFGGRTLYGGLLDFVCQRYGWTIDYCTWDISYLNLRLLSADASMSVYLSEEESKTYHAKQNVINADDPANSDAIRAFLGLSD